LAREVIEAAQQIDTAKKALSEASSERDNRQAQEQKAERDWKKAETDLSNAEAILATAQKDADRKQILRTSLSPAKLSEQNASQTVTGANAAIHLSEKLAKAEESLAGLSEDERNLEADLKANAAERDRCEAEGPGSQPLPARAGLVALLIGGAAATVLGIALEFRTVTLVLSVFACSVLASVLTAFVLWHRNRQRGNHLWSQRLSRREKAGHGLAERKNRVSSDKAIAQVQVDHLRSQRDLFRSAAANLTLEEAKERHQEAKKEVERIELQLQTLANNRIPVEEAERNVKSAKKALSDSKEELAEAQKELTKARTRVEILKVQLSNASAKFEELCAKTGGKAAAQETLAQALRELEETSAPGLPGNFEESEALLTRRQINQVGGMIAREQRDQEREALEHLEKSGTELELEFCATKRLLDVLKEEEAQHGADLGRCLAGPVTASFLELTDSGRYSQVGFEPGLRVQNVKTNEEDRDWGSLSAGTRDQLATLIRLTLAAHLKSVVVLDDQLAQSDPDRLLWFRDRLRASVRVHGHQIIVITCRPLDYLAPEEMLAATTDKSVSDDGLLTVMDLRRVIS
jgi:hypothetical protein